VAQNGWRSLFTLVICGLGTAGVIVAGSLGQAHLSDMEVRLHALGGRLVVVSPNKLPPYPGRPRQLDHFISLEPEDAPAVAVQVPHLQNVVPVVARNTTLRLDGNASRIRLLGTHHDYLKVRGFALARGRFLQPGDEGQRVIVLGQAASRELRPQGVQPGEVILLGGHPYGVVGVVQPQGVNVAGEDEDHQAFIPLDTYQQRIANRLWLSHLYLQLSPQADAEKTVRQVQRLLRERHNRRTDQVDDVIVRDVADVSAQQTGLLATALWVVSVTSGLLLVLGVVGIATLMLQVVRQRQPEIGLRRAIGATPFDVALQFFLEGMGLAVTGVVAGLLLGLVGTWLGQQLMGRTLAVQPALLVLAALVSLLAGGMACLAPAVVAARMEPAAALRA
jgi:putative ABC transport system permease protein